MAPEWFCELTSDRLVFNKAVKVLCDYALVEADATLGEGSKESRGYGMHSCVHAWTKHIVNESWDDEMAGLALSSVNTVLAGREDETTMIDAIHRLGYLYRNQGKLDAAEAMCQRALQGYEKALRRDHTSTLQTVNNLGVLYDHQGKLDKAKEMYQRALQGYEKHFESDYPRCRSLRRALTTLQDCIATQSLGAKRDP
ncbi:tetratricopeptide repeat domain containing protein [Pyrenophora teres f. teres]|uniref:Tetratricopeptide repeat domain containing protein n=1 Tax=Pyrenophora teres f. teres TaxID=97479 RepID=A0A6S6VD02_9PLEO|nr:tetratricopeptide repeat domain containing protein [Pyrenophora teres f. teres]